MASFFLFYCFASKETTPLLTHKISNLMPGRGNGPLRSYVLGDKRKLGRSLKWAHKVLTIQHLFTPSGLHLSSIFLLILPLLKKLSPRIRWFISLTLFILPLFLPGFWAIKRICLLRILKLFFTRLSWFSVFLIAFTLDFFWGTFDQSPLSFCFSFLFLGLIFSLEGKDGGSLPLVLFTGQILISFFWQSLLNPFGIFIGQLISLIFSFLFPFFFIAFWVPYKFLLFPLDLFTYMVIVGAKISKDFPSFYITFDILILFFIMSASIRLKIKVYLIILFICFYPPNLFNLPPKYFHKKRRYDFYLVEERAGINSIKRTRRGYKIKYNSGYTCSYSLFNTFWQKSCF